QDIPFERLVEVLNPTRTLTRHPLFQIMLTLQNSAWATVEMDGLAVEPMAFHTGEQQFDLSMELLERFDPDGRPDGMTGKVHYGTALFDRDTVERLTGIFGRLLARYAEAPHQPIGAAELLDSTEHAALLADGRGPERPLPETSVTARFAEQVAAAPDAVALVFEGCEVTYAELDRRANRLARRLLALGVRAEDRVAVLQRRSVELVVSVLAVLKAGGAYVPIDPRSPLERQAEMMADNGVVVLVTDAEGYEAARAATVVVGVDALPEEDTDPGVHVRPDQLAYVMFTSGSTGKPKGVGVPHRNVVGFALDTLWSGPGQQRVLQHLAHSFDPSVYELWVPLLSGRQLVVSPPGELDVAELARTIEENAVRALAMPTAVFRLVAEDRPECLAGVHELMVGGEALPAAAARRVLLANPSLLLHNGYGPTETTVMPLAHTLRSTAGVPDAVPIGRPLDNRRVYVLDRHLRLVPRGVTGELYVSGAGLARG
ncbi:AMP-binding protein, partial [Streptomyces pactum]|uniref:AMP-binding protein n=1 Tax=Streptomyces pactum TaxID=68249 RepID=UPI0036F4B7BC